MKKFLGILLLSSAAHSYTAEIRHLDSKDKNILFTLSAEEKVDGDKKSIHVLFKSKDKVVVDESAVIDSYTAEIITTSIDQKQTKEKGTTEVVGDKVKLTYQVEGKPLEKKEFKKPKRFVAPGNFDDWLAVNFEELKKNKSMLVDFLIWDRLEIYKFKVTYLGLVELGDKKVHQFKLSIDNTLLSAFISPIQIWMSEDMKNMVRFEGRVAVKQVKGPGLENLDAEVLYFHSLKAAQ